MEEFNHALPPGYRLAEYRIEKLLGEGGFGLTYLAFDENLETNVAIKEYLPVDFAVRTSTITVRPRTQSTVEAFEWGLNAFINEARTLAKFHHPNIVQVYRYFEVNGTACIVMEYVEGRTLKKTVKDLGRLNQEEVMAILLPVLDGLAEVHEAEILHRDIKPDNIIIRNDGEPVLIDFGAARHALGAKSRSITTIITPGYAPIEQYSSKGNVGPWSDIYALGAVAYYCLTETCPEDASDRVISDQQPAAAIIAKDQGSEAFLAAVDGALSVTPEQRPHSLLEWASALRGQTIPQRQVKARSNQATIRMSSLPGQYEADAGTASSGKAPENIVINQPESARLQAVGVESSTNRTAIKGVLGALVFVFFATIIILIIIKTPEDPIAGGQSSETVLTTGTAEKEPSNLPHELPQTPPEGESEQSPEVSQPPELSTFAVTIRVVPAAASIVLSDIPQTYYPGIPLQAGNYPVEVSMQGYHSQQLTLVITNQPVNKLITLEPLITPEEQQAYESAHLGRSIVSLSSYLETYPEGTYTNYVSGWLEQALAERQREEERQRELENARQAERRRALLAAKAVREKEAWQHCRSLEGRATPTTGIAYFSIAGANSTSDFKMKIGRFTARPKKLGSGSRYRTACGTNCYEVRSSFGIQPYFLTIGDSSIRGSACFYYTDQKPHIYKTDS